MEYVDIQPGLLKIIAVMFVLMSAFEKEGAGRRRGRLLILTSLIIPGTAIIHWTGSGTGGLLYSLSGSITAGLLSLALSIGKDTSIHETAASMALGSIFGPAGSIFIFLIVYLLDIAQKALRAETSRVSDLLEGHMIEQFANAADDRGSQLVSIETSRIARQDAAGPRPGDRLPAGGAPGPAAIAGNTLPVMPWRVKIALASLSVLMSGVFI